MDPKAYGVEVREAYVTLELGETKLVSKTVQCLTLDPTWDETFVIPVSDIENGKLVTTFFFGGKQIGIPCEFSLNSLKKNKSTFKGMPVVGGKIDFLLRALDFGEEEVAAAEDDFDPFEMM